MNTEPERSMYQLVANSPVLKIIIIIFYLLPVYVQYILYTFIWNKWIEELCKRCFEL